MKKLFVSSDVQAALLKEVLIPEMANGFWKNHRPANHAAQWADVEIIVSEDSKLGPVDFTIPRNYNFVNPEFIKPNEATLVACAQKAKASSNFRSVKKELIELSRIVGGRLADKEATPTKANRGNNKQAGEAKAKINQPKRTAVKKTDSNVTVTKTSSGATVRRVAANLVEPETTEV